MVNKTQRIYVSTIDGAFEEMLRNALSRVDATALVKLAIFSHPADNAEYRQNLAIIDNVVKEIFGEPSPLTSYIAQKTSHGGVTVEATYIADSNATIQTNTIEYILLISFTIIYLAPNCSVRIFLTIATFSSSNSFEVASQRNLRYGSVFEGRMLNHQSGNSTR